MFSPPPLSDSDAKAKGSLPFIETLLQPVRALQAVLYKQNYLIKEPLLDLPSLPPHNDQPVSPFRTMTATTPTSTHPSFGLTTAPPLLLNREALPQVPTDCNSQINQFKSQFSVQNSQQIASVSQQAVASISRASVAQVSAQSLQAIAQSSADLANSALLAIQTSASQALSLASASVSTADSFAAAASAGSSSAVSSASLLVAIASSSASSSISSALISVSSLVAAAQASASAAISSANSSIQDAKATATFEISQAKATVNSVDAQAAASIKASQVQAITATQAAIAIVGSIIGSSLLSILAYFLLSRYKKRKRLQKKQAEDREIKTAYISRVSDIQNRTSSSPSARSGRISEPYVQPPSMFEFTLPKQQKRPFWSFGSAKNLGSTSVIEGEVRGEDEPRPSATSRNPTLVYDPDFPTEPPKFGSSERETNDFSGFDGDFVANAVRAEDDRQRREEGRPIQRETIGAAI